MGKLLAKWDLLDTPKSGTAKDWRLWEERMRRERPVRWFIQKDLWEHGIARQWTFLGWRWRDFKWAVLHRYHPKHRMHVVDTGLEPGWHDPRTQILHGAFHTFKTFYERQLTGHVDWQGDEHHQKTWDEMTALYEWWTKVRPHREETLEPLPRDGVIGQSFMAVFDDDYQDRPEVKEWRRVADAHNKAEQGWEQEDEVMLIRLIKIRRALWD